MSNTQRLPFLAAVLITVVLGTTATAQDAKKKRHSLLYVVEPGIRNYLEFGGAGILVFDIDDGHKIVVLGIGIDTIDV